MIRVTSNHTSLWHIFSFKLLYRFHAAPILLLLQHGMDEKQIKKSVQTDGANKTQDNGLKIERYVPVGMYHYLHNKIDIIVICKDRLPHTGVCSRYCRDFDIPISGKACDHRLPTVSLCPIRAIVRSQMAIQKHIRLRFSSSQNTNSFFFGQI